MRSRLEPFPPHKAALFPALREVPRRGKFASTKGFLLALLLGAMVGIAILLADALFRT